MADALVTQLARALHLPPDAAQQTLHHLVSTLREQIEADGEAAVPGLGVFRQADGRLDFEPEDALVRAVNHRYAGLSALGAAPVDRASAEADAQIPAGFKPLPSFIEEESHHEPDPEAEPDELSDDELLALLESQEAPSVEEDPGREDALPEEVRAPAPEAFEPDEAELEQAEPEDAAVPPLAATLPDDPVPVTPDELALDTSDEPDLDASSDLDELLACTWTEEADTDAAAHPLGPLSASPVEEADYSLVEPDPTADTAPPDETHVEDDEPTVSAPAVASLTPEYAGAPPPEDSPAAGPVAAAPAVAAPQAKAPPPKRPSRVPLYAGLAVGAVLALAFLLWTRSRAPEPPPVAVRPPAADTVAAVPPPAELDTITAPVAPIEPPVSADPLRSTGRIDPAEGGVTWVVASELSQAAAERQVERYRAQGLRAGVVAEQAAGRTRYRVSLGQFESVAAAEARRADLPADVPSDSWILRL